MWRIYQFCTSLPGSPNILLATCQVEVPSSFVGLVLENCQLPFENYGHVILADPSPILFYRISSTEVRCLVDIPGQKVSLWGGMANYLKATVASQVSVMILHVLEMCIVHCDLRSKKLIPAFIFFFVSGVIYRFHLSFRMLSYLQLIEEILESCLIVACQLIHILLRELC